MLPFVPFSMGPVGGTLPQFNTTMKALVIMVTHINNDQIWTRIFRDVKNMNCPHQQYMKFDGTCTEVSKYLIG